MHDVVRFWWFRGLVVWFDIYQRMIFWCNTFDFKSSPLSVLETLLTMDILKIHSGFLVIPIIISFWKNNSRCFKDAGFRYGRFTLVTSGNFFPITFQTPSLPVSALAHFRGPGPRKRFRAQSLVISMLGVASARFVSRSFNWKLIVGICFRFLFGHGCVCELALVFCLVVCVCVCVWFMKPTQPPSLK